MIYCYFVLVVVVCFLTCLVVLLVLFRCCWFLFDLSLCFAFGLLGFVVFCDRPLVVCLGVCLYFGVLLGYCFVYWWSFGLDYMFCYCV